MINVSKYNLDNDEYNLSGIYRDKHLKWRYVCLDSMIDK